MSASPNQKTAVGLAEMGFRVFPCNSDKTPMVKGWPDTPLRPAWQVDAVWASHFSALPAIPVGAHGLLVIDCDRKNGKDGVVAFTALCAERGIELSNVFAVETPSTGLHFYWRTDEPYGNSSGALPDGIDVRGIGGFVIAPGATLPDGRAYKIVQGSWDTIPALPAALAPLLRPKMDISLPSPAQAPQNATERERAYAENALADEVEQLAAMHEGQGRNQALNDAALKLGSMVAVGWIERETVDKALWDASERNGYRAKDGDKAARNTLQSGLQSGIARPHEPLKPLDVPQWVRHMLASWIEAYKAKQSSAVSFIDSIKSPFDYDCKAKGNAIESLIPLSAITLITGDAGCGKSTLITVMADAIAKGDGVFTFDVKEPRPVLYLDRENTLPIIQDRLRRLRIMPGPRFKYWGAHINGEVPLPGCAAILEWIERTEPKPVVFVDSMVAFMEGNENSAEDVRAFFNPLRHIAHLGAAVVILHHTGKGESTQYFRGSSDIKGAIDNGFVMRNEGETRLTTVTLQAFKTRYAVTDKFALSYQDGEFVAKDAEQASALIVTHLLRSNAGISMKEFEDLLRSKSFGRNQARKTIEMGIAAGTILTRKGDRNATLLYAPESIPHAI